MRIFKTNVTMIIMIVMRMSLFTLSLLGQLEPDNDLHRERMMVFFFFRMINLISCLDWQNNLAIEDEEESPRDHKEEVEGEEDQPSRETVCKIS